MNCDLTVTPENHDQVVELGKQLVAASLNDEGVIAYDILESTSRPGKMLIFETWKDQASLDKHMASTHFTTLVPQIQNLGTLEIKQINQPKEVNLDPAKPFRLNITKTTAQRDAYIEAVQWAIEESNKEEGCVLYDYYKSLTKDDTLVLLEIWKDQAASDHHKELPHFIETQAKIKDMTASSTADRMAE
jgi:quinol monooxygenase YgiN